MENAIIKAVYLVKANHKLLEIKINTTLKDLLWESFEKYYIDNDNWNKALKDFSIFSKEDAENDNQKDYYKSRSDIPGFWEIKTNILNWNATIINTNSSFDEIQSSNITSWAIHIEVLEGIKKRDVIGMQSFDKRTMYVWSSFLESKLSLAFTNWERVFKKLQSDKILNLKKHIDVIHFCDEDKVFIFNKPKYNIIFNFYEEFKKALPGVFTLTFENNLDIFSYEEKEIPELILSIQENSNILRKVYITIHTKRLENFDLEKFRSHISEQGIWAIWFDTSWKIVLKKAGFSELIDAINSNYFSWWDNVNYVAKQKRKR